MKIQNQFSSWPQSFPSYFNSLLKSGIAPVLKAGSSGIPKGERWFDNYTLAEMYSDECYRTFKINKKTII